jgi:rhamnopyranosyl-N-acetylglucosaminyl-diphospho-decaprenol beta-1,3/1,4-galactofuranosyltransferase
VSHLLQQTYPLDILIYDNHSSADTQGALRENGLLCDRVTYYYADLNSGGAGGFSAGMQMAAGRGYDYLWLMDDDGYPLQKTTLETLIKACERIDDPLYILNSLVICDENTLRLSFSIDRSMDGHAIVSAAQDGLYADAINPFNGTLIPIALIQKIGYVRAEFFIYGDETEYVLRSLANGARVYTVVDSLYYHPTYVAKTKRFFTKKITVSIIPLWKAYCMARNTAFNAKQYFGFSGRMRKYAGLIVGALYAPKAKLSRLRVTLRGIRDGIRGDFSRKLDLTK